MLFAMVCVFSVMEATIHVHVLLKQTGDHKVSDRILLYLARLQFHETTECKLMCAVVLYNLHVRFTVALATMGC